MTTLPAPKFLDRRTPPTIGTLILLAGVSALSMNLFLPSLPAMAEDFGTRYGVVQLAVPVFLAANAMLQIVLGPLSDNFGRRPVILVSMATFAVASIGCAMASTVEVFLGFRMVQAVVVAGMVLGRAAVRDMVPGPAAASMIGYVTMGMAVVPMVAPAFGGVLEEWLGWRSGFVFMGVMGAAICLLVWRDFGETVCNLGRSLSEQVSEYPILLTAPRFWGYCAAAATASGAFFAYLGGAPFVGAEIYGLAPTTVGVIFGAPAVGYVFGNGLAGRLSAGVGIDRMCLWGACVATLGLVPMLLIELAGFGGPLSFFGLMILVGTGNGMLLPNATAGMLSVRPRVAGSASGLGGAIMLAGGAALSAFGASLLEPGFGAGPLIVVMVASSGASVLSVLYVIHRARRTRTT